MYKANLCNIYLCYFELTNVFTAKCKYEKSILYFRRFAFLFEHSILMCKPRGDNYDVKEIFDLTKFKIGDVQPVGKGKVS